MSPLVDTRKQAEIVSLEKKRRTHTTKVQTGAIGRKSADDNFLGPTGTAPCGVFADEVRG